MQDFSQTFQGLSTLSMVQVMLLIGTGLILWIAGRRALKGGFIVIGLIVGAGIGWTLAQHTSLGIPPWTIACIGGLVVAIIGAIAYRPAVAVFLAALLGLLLPLGAWTAHDLGVPVTLNQAGERASDADDETEDWFDFTADDSDNDADKAADADLDADDPAAGLPQELAQWIRDIAKQQASDTARETAEDALPDIAANDELRDFADQQVQQIRNLYAQVVEWGKAAWERAPQHLHTTLIACGVIGALGGLLIGFVMPSLGGSLVASFGGSMIWLSGAFVAVRAFGAQEGAWLPATPTSALVVWIVVSLIGLAIQWTIRRRQADKPG